jgi:hypothetical protein
MLLVLRNIINASDDSVIMVAAPKINWFDLSDAIAKNGLGAFGEMGMGDNNYTPGQSSRFCINPLLTDAQMKASEAIPRAANLFFSINDQWSSVWPAGDTTISYPAMKAGVAAASATWDGQSQPPGPMTTFGSVIFVWIVPPNARPVTVTRIELISFETVASQPTGGRSLCVADGTYLINPNATCQPTNNPPSNMAVQMTSWTLSNTVTTLPPYMMEWNDPWGAFLSNKTIGPAVAPPDFATPVMQTIMLPGSIQSHARDFIADSRGDADIAIPGAPMVLFDLTVSDKVLPRYVGVLDYTRGEVLFDQSMIKKVEDGFLKFMKGFAWMMAALAGFIEWDDPVLAGAVNIFIDIENPPSEEQRHSRKRSAPLV